MLDYKNPQLVVETAKLQQGSLSWQSPSNLAIIKYWGKHGVQLPRNPSISFTLSNAVTNTQLEYRAKTGVDEGISLRFFFEDQLNEAFGNKVKSFFESITGIFPFIRQMHFTIHSNNSFPHSAGIASSASSMSALALCLCSLEDRLFGTLQDDQSFRQKASYVARLGSGSACRSIYPTMALWGKTPDLPTSSDLYAVAFDSELHSVFKTYRDDILIISKGEKGVSSSAGHQLMEQNTYAGPRYQEARQRLHRLLDILRSGDLEAFGMICEQEALTLHALMMCSYPPYILMRPNTLAAIEKIRQFRADTGHPLYFSLDAGPNLHLLYPAEIQTEVQNFIQESLTAYCENDQWLSDQVGLGPLES